jgi:hypothetical protein
MANRLNGGRRAPLVFLVQTFWTETRTGNELDQLVGGRSGGVLDVGLESSDGDVGVRSIWRRWRRRSGGPGCCRGKGKGRGLAVGNASACRRRGTQSMASGMELRTSALRAEGLRRTRRSTPAGQQRTIWREEGVQKAGELTGNMLHRCTSSTDVDEDVERGELGVDPSGYGSRSST